MDVPKAQHIIGYATAYYYMQNARIPLSFDSQAYIYTYVVYMNVYILCVYKIN